MEILERRLTRHAWIGLDTSIFIYHVEENPRYLHLTQTVLAMIQSGEVEGITSVVTLMELTVHPWRAQESAVAREYEALLVNFPNLRIVDVNRDTARRAAQLCALHNINPADALQVATTLYFGGTAFITNDAQLRRLSELLDVVLLDAFF